MLSSASPSDEVYLLRRLNGIQWDRSTQEALPAGFTLRAESGLSVFSEAMYTPRALLQKLLDYQHEKNQDNPQKLANWLRSNGANVEEMVDRCHWRVARVPRSAFPSPSFTIGEPDTEGHIEIRGTPEAFEQFSDKIAQAARLCSAEACKQ